MWGDQGWKIGHGCKKSSSSRDNKNKCHTAKRSVCIATWWTSWAGYHKVWWRMLRRKILTSVKWYTMLKLARSQHLLKYLCVGISCQFVWLVFCQGVLPRVYEQDGAKYHQLILPIEFRAQVMELLQNEQCHQAVECMLQLVWEWFYWSTLLQEITNWVKKCKWCQTAKGSHVDPNPSQESIIANNPTPWIYYV